MVHISQNIMESIPKRRKTMKYRSDYTIFDEFLSKLERIDCVYVHKPQELYFNIKLEQ